MSFNDRQTESKSTINGTMRYLLQEELDRRGFKTNREAAAFFSNLTGNTYSIQRISDWRNGNAAVPRDIIAHLLILEKRRNDKEKGVEQDYSDPDNEPEL